MLLVEVMPSVLFCWPLLQPLLPSPGSGGRNGELAGGKVDLRYFHCKMLLALVSDLLM